MDVFDLVFGVWVVKGLLCVLLFKLMVVSSVDYMLILMVCGCFLFDGVYLCVYVLWCLWW